jgi:hypothetical protein
MKKNRYKMPKDFHVEPKDNGLWCIREEGKSSTNLIFDTKADALREAQRMAMNEKSSVILYDEKGIVVEEKTFKNAPGPDKSETF